MAASRARLARVATAVAALALAGALTAYPALAAERLPEVPVALGAGGVIALAFALAGGWVGGIAWTLVLLAAAYASELVLRRDATIDPAAPLVAAGLLLLAELAYWSLELRAVGREDAVVVARRVVALVGVVVGSLALGAFVVAVTVVPLGGGLAWDVVGVAAAAATLAILARLARSPSA